MRPSPRLAAILLLMTTLLAISGCGSSGSAISDRQFWQQPLPVDENDDRYHNPFREPDRRTGPAEADRRYEWPNVP